MRANKLNKLQKIKNDKIQYITSMLMLDNVSPIYRIWFYGLQACNVIEIFLRYIITNSTTLLLQRDEYKCTYNFNYTYM